VLFRSELEAAQEIKVQEVDSLLAKVLGKEVVVTEPQRDAELSPSLPAAPDDSIATGSAETALSKGAEWVGGGANLIPLAPARGAETAASTAPLETAAGDSCDKIAEFQPETTPAPGRTLLFSPLQASAGGSRALMIGAAFACLVASIGVAVLKFSDASSKPADISSIQPAPPATASQDPDLKNLPAQSSGARTPDPALPMPEIQSSAAVLAHVPQPLTPAEVKRSPAQPSRVSAGQKASSADAPNSNPERGAPIVADAAANTVSDVTSPSVVAPVVQEDRSSQPPPIGIAVSAGSTLAALAESTAAPALTLQPRADLPLDQPVVAAATGSDSNASGSTSRTPTPAVLISQASPVYPEVAKKMRVSGRVVLEIQIDAQGKVGRVKTVSGLAVLSAAAEDAVRRWRFKPASLGGTNVPEQRMVTVVFKNQ
jgi:TonB family protein